MGTAFVKSNLLAVNANCAIITLAAITMLSLFLCAWIVGLVGIGKFHNKKIHFLFKNLFFREFFYYYHK